MAKRLPDGRYVVEFQQAGRRVFRRCPPGIGKAEADQYEFELRRTLFREQALGERPIISLAAAIQLWLNEAVPTKGDNKKPGQNAALLAPFVGNKPLSGAPAAAQEAVQAWQHTLSTETLNRRLCVLKSACKHAWRRGLVEVNYSSRIPLFKPKTGREIYLTSGELARLAKAMPNERGQAAVMVLGYSGLRWSEFARLPAMPRRAAAFHVPISKTRKARMVPVVDTIRPYLHKLPMGVAYRTFWEWFSEARTKAGLEHVNIHDLRHTCASFLANKGVPLDVIAEILGDNLLTAQRYRHLITGTLEDAMRRIG